MHGWHTQIENMSKFFSHFYAWNVAVGFGNGRWGSCEHSINKEVYGPEYTRPNYSSLYCSYIRTAFPRVRSSRRIWQRAVRILQNSVRDKFMATPNYSLLYGSYIWSGSGLQVQYSTAGGQRWKARMRCNLAKCTYSGWYRIVSKNMLWIISLTIESENVRQFVAIPSNLRRGGTFWCIRPLRC